MTIVFYTFVYLDPTARRICPRRSPPSGSVSWMR